MLARPITIGALAAALIALTASTGEARGEPTCATSADGRTLVVNAIQSTRVRREGDSIVVAHPGGFVSCAGTPPTVTSIDTIAVKPEGRFPGLIVDLSGGALAPGATDEGDGSSEIEITMPRTVDTLKVEGSEKGERFAGGGIDGGVGVNLNAREQQDDADVILRRPRTSLFIRIEGGAGNDRLSANGGDGFTGPFAYGSASVLVPGSGDDRVTGSPGRDVVDAVGGADIVRVLAGNDDVETRDGPDDRIACGPGDDQLIADRGDEAAGCEDEILR